MSIKKGLGYFSLCVWMVMAFAACEKEAFKVDVNDGNEAPPPTKMYIEVTHQYSNYDDSLLPNVAVALFETIEDEQAMRYYRKDTTGLNGRVVLNNVKPGTFRIVLQHEERGTLRYDLTVLGGTLEGWQFYRFR